jgi:flagellar motor protein MotB
LNPTDSATYNSVSTTVRIRVLEQRFQTILTWNDPASIVYPAPLSRTQLNARANTPGAFTYDPGVGTVLNPGTHILKVDFEPTLSRTYQPASAQVTIVVTTSGGSTPVVPTPQQPIVVDTRPSTTPSNPNQGGGNTGGNPGNPNNPGNNTPPGQSNPVILIDSKSVNSVTITDRGPGVTNAQVRTDRIDIVTAPTFSGKTSVEVTYVQNSETRVVVVPLVIPPAPPSTAITSPQAMERSTIQWSASPNAISYDVYVRESLECQVRTTLCEVPFIVGPATPIRVVVIGGDATKVEVAPVFKQERVIPALTVNFATASSRLNAQFREELRDIADIIEREGFTSLIVYGHTDSRTYDNRTLSRQRAEATRDFLKRLLPNVEFKIAGFAATQRVAAENTRAGLAQNRRAEVRIAG